MTEPSVYVDDDVVGMTGPLRTIGDRVVVQREHLQQLLDALHHRGYQVIGPTVRDSAIVYEEIDSVADLPVGWTDEQDNGSYRLVRRSDDALFGYTLSPQSWKQFLHLPMRRLWQARRTGEDQHFEIVTEEAEIPRRAFLGVRACELHAIAIQDKVLTDGPYIDPAYKALRDNCFIIAVNCDHAGGTCFCASMKTGPAATEGFDLAMTEIVDLDRHIFVVEVGTQAGADLLQAVPHETADTDDIAAARQVVAETSRHMGRTMTVKDPRKLLYANYEHPHWDDVAERCMTCGNCTSVCPTCFCVTVEDVTDLSGEQAERWQHWDSCFTTDFSYVHGGSVRWSASSRYRQWLTHKLATWIDQFGTSGCVGCGRCITWCPVGIDITAEIRAIQESTMSAGSSGRTAQKTSQINEV